MLSSVMLTYWRNFAQTGNPNESADGDSRVLDPYGLSGDGSLPDLPAWEPVTDPGMITEFRADQGTYVRKAEIPYWKLYDALDSSYQAGGQARQVPEGN